MDIATHIRRHIHTYTHISSNFDVNWFWKSWYVEIWKKYKKLEILSDNNNGKLKIELIKTYILAILILTNIGSLQINMSIGWISAILISSQDAQYCSNIATILSILCQQCPYSLSNLPMLAIFSELLTGMYYPDCEYFNIHTPIPS